MHGGGTGVLPAAPQIYTAHIMQHTLESWQEAGQSEGRAALCVL